MASLKDLLVLMSGSNEQANYADTAVGTTDLDNNFTGKQGLNAVDACERGNMSGPPGEKECWGEYGDRFGPEDRNPEECFTRPVAEQCFRVTVADAVVSTAANLSLIVDNLIAWGDLKDWDELRAQRET